MMEFLLNERVILAALGLIGTVLWFAIRAFFVTRKELEAQRKAEQEAYQAQRAADNVVTKSLADTVDKLADRVVGLESKVNALPTEAMLNKLMLRMETYSGEQKALQAHVSAIKDSMDGVDRHVTLIHEHLLEAKRG